jgi:predicted protein tyrosine phosphatase
VFVDEKTRDLMILMVKITQILTLSALEGTTTIVGVGLSPEKSPQVHIQHQGHHFFYSWPTAMSFTIHCHRGAGHNPKQGIK